jgi:hypothetical protein
MGYLLVILKNGVSIILNRHSAFAMELTISSS